MSASLPLALRIAGFLAVYLAASAFAIGFDGPSRIAMYWPASSLSASSATSAASWSAAALRGAKPRSGPAACATRSG